MKIADFLADKSNQALKYGEDYLAASEKYVKLKVFEQYSLALSFLVKLVVVMAFTFMALMFLLIAAAIALGNLFGSLALGCLAVGILFIGLTALVYGLRRNIDNKVIQSLSDKVFDDDEN